MSSSVSQVSPRQVINSLLASAPGRDALSAVRESNRCRESLDKAWAPQSSAR